MQDIARYHARCTSDRYYDSKVDRTCGCFCSNRNGMHCSIGGDMNYCGVSCPFARHRRDQNG